MKKCVFPLIAIVLIMIILFTTGCDSSRDKYTLKMDFNEKNIKHFVNGIAQSHEIKQVFINELRIDDGWSGNDAVAKLWIEQNNGAEYEAELEFGKKDGRYRLYIYADDTRGYDYYVSNVINQVEMMLGGDSRIGECGRKGTRVSYNIGDYSCELLGCIGDVSWYEISIHM